MKTITREEAKVMLQNEWDSFDYKDLKDAKHFILNTVPRFVNYFFDSYEALQAEKEALKEELGKALDKLSEYENRSCETCRDCDKQCGMAMEAFYTYGYSITKFSCNKYEPKDKN